MRDGGWEYIIPRACAANTCPYSMAHACSNTYDPVLSLYVVFAGAYIIHEPPGLAAIQLVAVPADV